MKYNLMANMKKTKGKVGVATKGKDKISSSLPVKNQIISNLALTVSRGPTSTIRVRNQEALNVPLIGSTASPWYIFNFLRVSPSGLSGNLSWLNSIAQQYSMYKIHNLSFRYVPTTGTTESGFFAMGFFPDAEDAALGYSTNGGTGSLGQLSQCRKFSQSPLYTGCSIQLDSKDFVHDWYYIDPVTNTSSESRLTVAGGLGLIVQSNPNLRDARVGILYVEYDVELKFPVATNPNVP